MDWTGPRCLRAAITCLVAALLLGVAVAPARADQAALTPAKDSTLFGFDPDRSSGAGESLFAGYILLGTPRRALMQFDLSAIPAGASVSAVSLSVVVAQAAAAATSQTFSLYRLTADWGEGGSDSGFSGAGVQATPGDATWEYRFYGDPQAGIARTRWTTVGGDFVSAPSSQSGYDGSSTLTFASTATMVADVQGWLDDPASNHGWILLGENAVLQTALRMVSGNAVVDRPMLTIVYAPVPEPTRALLLLAGVALLGLAARRRSR